MIKKYLQIAQSALLRRLTPEWQERTRRVAADMPRLLLINTGCGLAVTYVLRTGGSLFENMVISMLIGFTAYTLINGSKSLIWGDKEPHKIGFYAMSMLMAPLAFFIGLIIASHLFNYPTDKIIHFQWSHVSNFVVLTSVVSLIASWSFWSRVKMSELIAAAEAEKAKNAAIEKQALQAQLQMLQAQIEPHMLFNTLANLQGLIAIDPDQAQHMLAQLIVYLRNTLSSSRAEQTSLKQEFTLMQAYLELLAIRMGKRLRYTLDLPDELQQTRIAPMLLQPLVENAIKHGLEPKMEGGNIHVVAEAVHEQEASYLHLKVIDTGLGLPFDFDNSKIASTDGQHVGNANIRDRLLALYGPEASLQLIANQPEGAIAHLIIPLP